ncbi:MAG: tRNA 2-thiouridine(34) synthase MnmA [Flavobacteriales bacterium MED-G22]|nr:MAG: tRNA 2-thiouridine(34) synthase MnmA [Flavobacteriales bacterium MED-G22]|tara:strand:- start:5425 stop:6606 length:1182 start_codon:yes stop_codon:yes gene_type:complete
MKKKRVVVGLSGGVDSSVAAHLLVEQGYEVIGLFMKNWHDESVTISSECPWLEDSYDAMLVAEKLGIPFQTVDLSSEYKTRIVDYMFAEYERGRTPNPDVLCNREIKFDLFLKIALSLNADYVATGHYCQKNTITSQDKTIHQLLSGADINKDQSYFLCQLTQEQLAHALFPIGHLQKSEVRKIAKAQGFVTADKRDSQGLCFVGKVRLPDFLQQQLKPKEGKIIAIDENHEKFKNIPSSNAPLAEQALKLNYAAIDGDEVGAHRGAHYFTIGQRKGLAVGGTVDPLFVIDTDVNENVLYVGEGKNHPGLFRKVLKVAPKEVHWVREDLTLKAGEFLKVEARIRYRQPLQKATIHALESGYFVSFDQPQSAITSGQFVAWYQKKELLGSGVIT